jgi:serine/threonine-protein kinase
MNPLESPTSAPVDEASCDSLAGEIIADRYTIIGPLADGGGRVFLAEEGTPDNVHRLVLKLLLPESDAPELVARFAAACLTLRLVDHPNVVRIDHFGEAEPGVLYVAMELALGSSLATLIAEEGALPLDRALDVLAQICRGVAAAHDRGLVQCDLAPEKIMLYRRPGEADLVKLLDLGIAKTLATRPPMGIPMGSPPYTSPEQFLGEAVDARADVYALGVIAYQIFTGELPFRARDENEWAVEHVTAAPRSFDATLAGGRVPRSLRRVILRALEKEPDDRPKSVRAFLRELVAAMRPTSMPVAPRPAVTRPSRNAGWWAFAGSLAALVSGVAFSVATRPSDVPGPPRSEVTPGENVAPFVSTYASPPTTVEPSTSPKPPPSPSPDRHAVAVASPAPNDVPAACEHALQATDCTEARGARDRCVDAPDTVEARVRYRVNQVCAAQANAQRIHDLLTITPPAPVPVEEPRATAGIVGPGGLATY